MDNEELFQGVCRCIRETLGQDLPDIKESDSLIRDLGADSLDFLDLVFRLEKTFGVRVNPRDMERRTQEALGETPMMADGKYTAAAVEEFIRSMPEVPAGELYADMPTALLPQCFRVKTFMNLVAYVSGNTEQGVPK